MINIKRYELNDIVVTLKPTFVNPVFDFTFTDIYNRIVDLSLNNISATPQRFYEFLYLDGSQGNIQAAGTYTIKEVSGNISNILLTDNYQLVALSTADSVFDPSIYYGNSTDPSAATEIDQSYVFDPLFFSAPEPAAGFPTFGYVDGSLLARDSSLISLQNQVSIINAEIILLDPSVAIIYVNDQIALRDVSIAWLNTNKIGISDLNPYATNASIGLAGFLDSADLNPYATNSSVGNALKSYATNASIGLAGFAKSTDLNQYATNSSVGLALQPLATNASIGLAGFAKQTYIDGSLATRDSSITNLFGHDLSLDASIIRIDGSLNYIFPKIVRASGSQSAGGYAYYNGTQTIQADVFLRHSTTGKPALNIAGGFIDPSIDSRVMILAGGENEITYRSDIIFDSSYNLLATNASINAAGFIKGIAPSGFGTSLIKSVTEVKGLSASTNIQLRNDNNNQIWIQADVSNLATNSSINQIYIKDASQDASILWLQNNTLTTAALYPYATNASVGLALQPFATNASISLAGFAKQTYVDGSLALRDSSITDLYNSQTLFATNASIGLAGFLKSADLNPYATNSSVNSAGFLKSADLNPFATNASVGLAIQNFATNSSVNIAWETLNTSTNLAIAPLATNASVGLAISNFATNSSVNLSLTAFATNASIGIAGFLKSADLNSYATNSSVGLAIAPFATNASVGTAIGPFATNSSVGLAIQNFATNSSVGLAIQNFATNSSVNSALNPFATNASVGTAISIFATNASIGTAAFAKNASLANYTLKTQFDSSIAALYTNTYLDASFNKVYTDVSNNYVPINSKFSTANSAFLVSASENNNVLLVDISALTITFPNTLVAGFTTTVVNETTGTVTLNASTLYTQDSSVTLRDKYSAATVICKSTGVFLAFGNLK
jgi:hypothetical protein